VGVDDGEAEIEVDVEADEDEEEEVGRVAKRVEEEEAGSSLATYRSLSAFFVALDRSASENLFSGQERRQIKVCSSAESICCQRPSSHCQDRHHAQHATCFRFDKSCRFDSFVVFMWYRRFESIARRFRARR